MPIYTLPGGGLSPGLDRLIFDEGLPEKSRAAERAREATPGETRELEISAAAHKLRLEAELIRGTFEGVEDALFGVQDLLFEQAGRSEYLESIELPEDLSASATAERILGGISGYIYRAFQLGHPDADLADLSRFKSEALRGFEQGLEEARGYIEALGDLNEELEERISETEDLVREGLEAFFDREEELLKSA